MGVELSLRQKYSWGGLCAQLCIDWKTCCMFSGASCFLAIMYVHLGNGILSFILDDLTFQPSFADVLFNPHGAPWGDFRTNTASVSIPKRFRVQEPSGTNFSYTV